MIDYTGYLFISLGITGLAIVYVLEIWAGYITRRRMRRQTGDDL